MSEAAAANDSHQQSTIFPSTIDSAAPSPPDPVTLSSPHPLIPVNAIPLMICRWNKMKTIN
ncbi:MAG: hypothetical protein KDE24_10530, partial [Caldilinea sp.]|nr:hypothetical protein [Caldilinea sp.]